MIRRLIPILNSLDIIRSEPNKNRTPTTLIALIQAMDRPMPTRVMIRMGS